ncbi:hypothetical protein C6P45_003804, partial [Maudiozyma exigua]
DAETIEDSNKEKVAMPDISKSVNNRENNLANEPTTNPRRSLIISNRISEIETSKHNETSRIATAKIDDLIETPKKNIATTDAVPEIETPRIETPKKNNSRIETPQKDNSTTVATPVFSPEEKNVFTQDTTNASESKGQLSSDETIKYLNQLIKLAQQLEEQGQDTGALKSSIVSIRQNLSKDEEEATDEVDSPTIDRSNKRVAPEISTPRTKKTRRTNKTQEVKDLLRKEWGSKGNVFEVLGIENGVSKYLYYDGMDYSALPCKWYRYDRGCGHCLMSPIEACVCFGSVNWIKTMAYESLITLHCILAPETFKDIVDKSMLYGCYSVLINVVENRKLYKELVEKRFGSFLQFMAQERTDLGQYPGFDSSREMLHMFNNLWSYMKRRELDIMAFCAGETVKFPRIWRLEDKGRILDSMRKHGEDIYKESGIYKNHIDPKRYVQKLLMHNFKG